MTVTKLELTHYLFDSTGLSTKECAALVDTLFDTIRSTLATGENVKLSGFGNFTLRDKRARPGRNQKNGEPVEISAQRLATRGTVTNHSHRYQLLTPEPLLRTTHRAAVQISVTDDAFCSSLV